MWRRKAFMIFLPLAFHPSSSRTLCSLAICPAHLPCSEQWHAHELCISFFCSFSWAGNLSDFRQNTMHMTGHFNFSPDTTGTVATMTIQLRKYRLYRISINLRYTWEPAPMHTEAMRCRHRSSFRSPRNTRTFLSIFLFVLFAHCACLANSIPISDIM